MSDGCIRLTYGADEQGSKGEVPDAKVPMKRWLGLFLILVMMAVAVWLVARPALVTPVPVTPAPEVSWLNLKQIHAGMSQQEVVAILGRPPQASMGGPQPITDSSPTNFDTVLLWSDTDLDILVYLDKVGRVISCEGNGSHGERSLTRSVP